MSTRLKVHPTGKYWVEVVKSFKFVQFEGTQGLEDYEEIKEKVTLRVSTRHKATQYSDPSVGLARW